MAPVVRLRTMNHPLPPDLLITEELVPSLFEESIIQSSSKLFQLLSFLPQKKFLMQQSFFSFIFIAHFFMGLRELV